MAVAIVMLRMHYMRIEQGWRCSARKRGSVENFVGRHRPGDGSGSRSAGAFPLGPWRARWLASLAVLCQA